MNGAALERVFREAGGRITAALAARFRDLDLVEDAVAEACARALVAWPREGSPTDPAAWLYRAAYRCAIDVLRRRKRQMQRAPLISDPQAAYDPPDEGTPIPDERLALIFVCCHPAVAVEARAALTLRLVCGLTTREIAAAFLVPEATLAQRLVRAKRKIADAGIAFEVPEARDWPERLDAVLSTLEVAYAKSHEDAAGTGPHAAYGLEVLELIRILAQLVPGNPEVLALAATTHLAAARRPARTTAAGSMVPLSEQDPLLWDRQLVGEGRRFLAQALATGEVGARVLQAAIHAQWCARTDLAQPPPWPEVLGLYDTLLTLRDDAVVRVNRAVAVAEVHGVDAALAQLQAIDPAVIAGFLPYHAVRADLLRRQGRTAAATRAYDDALGLVTTPAERDWLLGRRAELDLRRD